MVQILVVWRNPHDALGDIPKAPGGGKDDVHLREFAQDVLDQVAPAKPDFLGAGIGMEHTIEVKKRVI
ncbi:hypothetical protein LP415_19190 [Polaromonas sp. P1(28)-8]|nr:hypothetical protein LP415_19190 [Polaromonas sp. P1(28)-8]